MATFVSEDLNEREEVAEGPTRLNGYRFRSTGTRERFVEFFTGNERVDLVVVKPGEESSLTGLNEPYPDGLAIESRVGDGKLIASVFFSPSPLAVELIGAES